jgi:type II secretory pathway component PulK
MQMEERGSTLLVVVWLLAIMGIIATFLIYRSETEWAALVTTEKKATERELAEQALYEHLAVLLQDEKKNDIPEEDWFGKTGRFESEQDGYKITVIVEDEGSKPNLNLMTENALRCFKLPEGQPVTPILDWLDLDQKELDDGAEKTYYSSLNPAYKPRDGFFSSLQELLLVKDGQILYPIYAPELTVYGKLNFNILSTDQFTFILEAAGFDQFSVEQLVGEFQKWLVNTPRIRVESFTQLSNSTPLSSLNELKCDQLKPFLQFNGGSNINFMSRHGLAAVLAYASMGNISPAKANEVAKKIILYRNRTKTFESTDELETQLKVLGSFAKLNFTVQDYFTTTSSLIRYRVWVEKGERKYYLNTVQERVAGDLRVKWKVRTLAWQVLTNKMAPEIPEVTPFEQALNLETEETDGTEVTPATAAPAESGGSVKSPGATAAQKPAVIRVPVGTVTR